MPSLISSAIGIASLTVLTVTAQARDRTERVAERLQSNLPLYTFDWKDIWPRSFSSEDSFGCTSRVAFGDWRFVPADMEAGEELWERYSNYGVFHCAAIMYAAGERAKLDEAEWKYGFFVRLGKARLESAEWEIWALQKGTFPGSEYVLLARKWEGGKLIDSFRVLQQRCPPGRILEARGFDVWRTRYCAINSRTELFSLARRMLRLPPRGTIALVPEVSRSVEGR